LSLIRRTLWLVAFIISIFISATGQSSLLSRGPEASHKIIVPPAKAEPIRVPRFDKPPVIDGRLDDEVWTRAAVFKNFVQTRPGDNVAPSRETVAMVGYDSKRLYLAFHCYDEPDKVRATVAKRDEIFGDDNAGRGGGASGAGGRRTSAAGDDNIRVFLDTFNDQRRAYVLGWNPFGIQQDGIITEGQREVDFSIDIVMESKGMLTEDGWIVEVSIPFKSLRYQAGNDRLWGFNVVRNFFRFNNETDSWMPQSRGVSSQLSQLGHVTGLEGISTERTLELIPSLTISQTGRHVRSYGVFPNTAAAATDPGRLVNEPINFDPGLTAKFTITPTVILDLAINPDFAQVEADQTVVTANQRFPIFFQEKRPFFLEGLDIFQTSQLQPLHTRAIVDPDVAVKLTGKQERNTFGLMVASDNAPGNFNEDEKKNPVNARFIDKNALIGVLRAKRDVGKESSVGFLATSYNFIEKHNQLLGIDGRFRFDPQSVLSFQVVGTSSRRCFFAPEKDLHTPTATEPCFVNRSTRNYYRQGNGLGYFVSYNKTGRNFGWFYNGNGRTQDYRADVGFTRRVNTNRHEMFVRFSNDANPSRKLISWRLNYSTDANFDWQGNMQNWGSGPRLNLQLHKNTSLDMSLDFGYDRLFEQEFGARRTATHAGAFFGGPERSTYQLRLTAGMQTNPIKQLSGRVSLDTGWNEFDFDFGASERYPRVSPAALANPSAPLDPGPGRSLGINAGVAFQPTNELRASLDYTKSRLRRNDTRLLAFDENIFSFRSTYQFTRFIFLRARADYDTLEANVRGQLLFGYTPNPGTAFYVGYNDDLNRNGFNPFTGQLEPGFRRNGRTFFVKMSYLIRKSFGG